MYSCEFLFSNSKLFIFLLFLRYFLLKNDVFLASIKKHLREAVIIEEEDGSVSKYKLVVKAPKKKTEKIPKKKSEPKEFELLAAQLPKCEVVLISLSSDDIKAVQTKLKNDFKRDAIDLLCDQFSQISFKQDKSVICADEFELLVKQFASKWLENKLTAIGLESTRKINWMFRNDGNFVAVYLNEGQRITITISEDVWSRAMAQFVFALMNRFGSFGQREVQSVNTKENAIDSLCDRFNQISLEQDNRIVSADEFELLMKQFVFKLFGLKSNESKMLTDYGNDTPTNAIVAIDTQTTIDFESTFETDDSVEVGYFDVFFSLFNCR